MISLKHFKTCPSALAAPEIEHKALSFCTDTRKYKHPSAFVAIPGAKTNPLDVMGELLEKKIPLVCYEQNDVNDEKVKVLKHKYPSTSFVPVKDSVTFLQELTSCHVQEWKSKSTKNTIFAISGSNGKTTHKEMLSFILKSIIPGKVVATEKNNNNHLGVPLTLLNVTDTTEFVVLELGSNHPGEIKVLCDIARPNAGLTTNIGATHLEFFGTEEAVFEEEAYLYYAVKKFTHGEGFFLINKDDHYLRTLVDTVGSISYGSEPKASANVSFFETGATITYQGADLSVHNDHITGRHNKLNLVTTAFIAQHFYPAKLAEIVKAASEFTPTRNRSEWIEFDGKSVFLDAYNANPSSMKAALEGFKESILDRGLKLTDSCVVLGDMNELGDNAPKYHAEVGNFVHELGFPNVYFVGRYADFYKKGHPQGEKKESSAKFKPEYRGELLKKFSIHFIKGSRSLQLESLFDIT